MRKDIAIDIAPEIKIVESENDAFLYYLDTGVEDLNRTINSDVLENRKFRGITIDGFDKYYRINDVKELRNLKHGVDTSIATANIEDSINLLEQKKVSAIVLGTVCIELAGDNKVELCHPIYQVLPNKKGEMLPIDDVKNYIKTTWTETIKAALFSSSNDTAVVNKGTGATSSNILSLTNLFAAFLAIMVFTMAIYIAKGSNSSYSTLTSNNNGNLSYGLATTATSNANSANSLDPNSAIYGGGYTGQEGQASIEDFSNLQVEETQKMLKKMGVDVSTNPQDLGCFVEGES